MRKLESGDHATMRDLKKGDLFRFSETGKLYIRDDYDRSEKMYWYFPFDDVNGGHYAKPNRKIIVE